MSTPSPIFRSAQSRHRIARSVWSAWSLLRFRTRGAGPKRQQAGRTPNASRGRAPEFCVVLLPASPNETTSLLSVLIFSPLPWPLRSRRSFRSERLLRWWTLAFTTAVAIFSLQLYWKFDTTTAAFSFSTLPVGFRPGHQYAVGIDGISLLLVLLTTLIMPYA